jgi:prepilin-type N-terminal cleavage/methylation domain-containing protein
MVTDSGNVPTPKAKDGFTLFEVVISLMIIAVVFGGIIRGYTSAANRAEWSGYSLAAQGLAVRQLEEARSAVYDPPTGRNEILTMVGNLNNFVTNSGTAGGSGYSWTNLDLPSLGGKFVRATNYVTVARLTSVGGIPSVQMYSVRVDTVWPYRKGNSTIYCTNTVYTYVAPDNPNVQ